MHARRTLSATLAVLFLATPAAAQTHKVAVSLFGGGTTYTNMASGSGGSISLQNGWLTGAQVEVPFGRLGIRLNGSYTDRPLSVDSAVNLNVFTMDLDVMLRVLPPTPGRLFDPYVALGAGAAMYKLGPSASTTGVQISGGGSVQRPTVMAALGTDIGSGPVAFRVEMSDILDLHSPLLNASGSAYGPVHHIAASAGVSFRIGGGRAAPMRLTEREMAPPETPQPVSEAAEEPQPESQPAAQPQAAPASAAPVVAAAAPQPAPKTQPTPKAQPAAPKATPQAADSALANRFNAWDKVESLEVQIAQLKRRVAELETTPPTAAAASAAASKPATATRAAPTTAAPAHGTLYTVQIASYLDGESPQAVKAVAELKTQGIPVWVSREGVEGRMVNRVRVGALTTKTAAERLSRYINRAYEWPTWVTQVPSSVRVQQSEVTATQAFVRAKAR
ncbi:MAG: SPOR domain-containing protein [Gemmatimonadota bacterium]